MNREHTLKLYNDFNWLYRMRHKEEGPIAIYGFECGDGWFDLIYRLSMELTDYGGKRGRMAAAVQVKEKFGTLKFYVDRVGDGNERKIIERYEKLSAETCEVCGKNGRLIEARTRCGEHMYE